MDLSSDVQALNFSNAMGESNCTLTILDVANILQTNFGFISGGRSRRNFVIVSFPECSALSSVPDEQFKTLVAYLTSILSPLEHESGVVVVIDRRKDKWSSVKTLLLQITDFFPTPVQKVYVLKPLSFLQKTFADTGLKFIKDDFRVKILILESTNSLHDYIDKDQLTSEFDGTLVFNLSEWIQHRAALEKFSANTSKTNQSLRFICNDLQEREFPNDVLQTEVLIHDHETIKLEIKEDLESTIKHGKVLLECFVGQRKEDDDSIFSDEEISLLPKSKQAHVCAAQRLLLQLEETSKNFDAFWDHHKMKLEQCLQLRKFEEDFKQLQFACGKHLSFLESIAMKCDSVVEAETLLNELQKFENESKADITRASLLKFRGEKFIGENHYALDCIKPKCCELDRIIQTYQDTLTAGLDKASKSKELFEKIDNVDKWCTKGVDFLACRALEKNLSHEEVTNLIAIIESSLVDHKTFDLDDPKQFHQQFNSILTPELKQSLQKVLSHSEDVHEMLKKCKEQLKARIREKPVPIKLKPIHVVQPDVSSPVLSTTNAISHPNPFSQFSMSMINLAGPSSSSSSPSQSAGQAAPVIINVPQQEEVEQQKSKRKFSFKKRSKLERTFSKSTQNLDSIKANGLVSNVGKEDNMQIRRCEILTEILSAERAYVDNLQMVLKHYIDQMNSVEMISLMPENLVDRQNDLFANWSEICHFHSNVFLKEIESAEYVKSVETMCFSFTIHKDILTRNYLTYCGNKMISGELLQKISACDFLKECQKRSGSNQTLEILLTKPFHQLHIYHNLLKDLMKYSSSGSCQQNVKETSDLIAKLVQLSTEAMNLISIEGFDGDLTAGGKLIQQGSFHVQTEGKNRSFLKGKSGSLRHLFLYENFLMICKEKSETNGNEKSGYIFKALLPTSEMALTEFVKGDKRKFNLSVHKTSESYIIQASTVNLKDLWVSEIKRILLGQFEKIKSDNENRNSFKSFNRQISLNSCVKVNGNNNVISSSGLEENDSTKTIFSSMLNLSQIQSSIHLVTTNHSATRPDEISLQKGTEVLVVNPGEAGWSLIREVDNPNHEGWFPTRLLDEKQKTSAAEEIIMHGLKVQKA